MWYPFPGRKGKTQLFWSRYSVLNRLNLKCSWSSECRDLERRGMHRVYTGWGFGSNLLDFPGGSDGGPGSIPGSGRFSGEGNGTPLQYSSLENPMDGGESSATVHGVTKSLTWLSNFTFTFYLNGYWKKKDCMGTVYRMERNKRTKGRRTWSLCSG